MEIWDLYNADRVIIGEHVRGEKLPPNGYHLAVHVWIRNSEGKFLISQRSENRPTFPLMWECVGGSVLKGENSLQGALREAKEEVGITLDENSGKIVFSRRRDTIDKKTFNDFVDVWLFEYDGEITLEKATTDEVKQSLWLTKDEIMNLYLENKLVHTLNYFFQIF